MFDLRSNYPLDLEHGKMSHKLFEHVLNFGALKKSRPRQLTASTVSGV